MILLENRISGSEWLMDPFALKYFSLIQNNFGGTFGLNFVTCEQGITLVLIVWTRGIEQLLNQELSTFVVMVISSSGFGVTFVEYF